MIDPCKTLFNGGKPLQDPLYYLKDLPELGTKRKKRGRPKGSKNKKKQKSPPPSPSLPKEIVTPLPGLTESPLDGLPNITNDTALWTLDEDAVSEELFFLEEDEVLDFGFAPVSFKNSLDILNSVNPENKVLNYVHVLSHLKTKLEKDRSNTDFNDLAKEDLVESGILNVPKIMSNDEIEFLLSWSMNLLSQRVREADEKLIQESFERTFPPILREEESPHLDLGDILPTEDLDLDLLQESIEHLFFEPFPLPTKIIVEEKKRRGRPRRHALCSKNYKTPTKQCSIKSFIK